MTAEDRNKSIAAALLLYGGLHACLAVLATLLFFLLAIGSADPNGYFARASVGFVLFISICVLPALICVVPALIAALGLLRQKQWARKAGIVAGLWINLIALLVSCATFSGFSVLTLIPIACALLSVGVSTYTLKFLLGFVG